MKSINNILRGSNMTPLERVTVLVHNDVYREKSGKDMLSDSEIYELTKGWYPSSSEAQQYNRYIRITQLEDSMGMDARMFLYEAEIQLLRNHRVLDSFISCERNHSVVPSKLLAEEVSSEESLKFVTEHTYLEYEKTLHRFTFNKLSKEVQEDLLVLDEEIAYEGEYISDHVFLYEIFNGKDGLNKDDKDLIITTIYSRMYCESIKNLKRNKNEKDGFFLRAYFGDLPVKDLFQKIAKEEFENLEEKDFSGEDKLIALIEKIASKQNISMERLVKEKLSEWLDHGLFIKEYSALFTSNHFDTWNGKTKKKHKELFFVWYKELQKSKQYFQVLFEKKILDKTTIEKDFFGSTKTLDVIPGNSIYSCGEDVEFVAEYRKQIEVILPVANIFLFIRKNTTPIKNYKTLCEFKDLAQKVSSVFEIDMTEKYSLLVESYKDEVLLLNRRLGNLIDLKTEHLYTKKSFEYILGFNEKSFLFQLDEENNVLLAKIVQMYTEDFDKLNL